MNLRTAFHCFGLCLAFGLASAAGCPTLSAQPQRAGDTAWLARTLATQEAVLSQAYNACDLHRLRAYILQGASVATPDGRRVDPLKEARGRICGRMRRNIVAGSLVVRPVGNTGALVVGEERFCPVGKASCSAPSNRFVARWARYDRAWRVAWIRRLPASTVEHVAPTQVQGAIRTRAPR